jgi:hypothetical protein
LGDHDPKKFSIFTKNDQKSIFQKSAKITFFFKFSHFFLKSIKNKSYVSGFCIEKIFKKVFFEKKPKNRQNSKIRIEKCDGTETGRSQSRHKNDSITVEFLVSFIRKNKNYYITIGSVFNLENSKSFKIGV